MLFERASAAHPLAAISHLEEFESGLNAINPRNPNLHTALRRGLGEMRTHLNIYGDLRRGVVAFIPGTVLIYGNGADLFKKPGLMPEEKRREAQEKHEKGASVTISEEEAQKHIQDGKQQAKETLAAYSETLVATERKTEGEGKKTTEEPAAASGIAGGGPKKRAQRTAKPSASAQGKTEKEKSGREIRKKLAAEQQAKGVKEKKEEKAFIEKQLSKKEIRKEVVQEEVQLFEARHEDVKTESESPSTMLGRKVRREKT
jgi:hypothetical protein